MTALESSFLSSLESNASGCGSCIQCPLLTSGALLATSTIASAALGFA